tara:strand:+ start:543 stop:1481 length:939 start_codon:yes stop_codon:yes gene_type:complete
MYKKTKIIFGLILTGISLNAQNLVLNGDFEAGNNDFTSDYLQDCPNDKLASDIGTWHEGAPNDGQYCVTEPYDWSQNGSNQLGNWFPVSQSVSNGVDGKMLHVNGDIINNSKVWCQSISNIQPNSKYKFSTWISTIYATGNPPNVAELQFSINGSSFGQIIKPEATPGNWNLFFEVWDSGLSTSADICIVNKNTISNGNDFVLDKISFEPLNFTMPNLFSPDGDGINEVFTPISFAGINTYNLNIFNRWGRKMATITEKDMDTPEWNGKTSNGDGAECHSGVYYWTITYGVLIGSQNIEKVENGYVHLVGSH